MRIIAIGVLLLMSACALSPVGEDEERARAERARPREAVAPLSRNASLDEVLTHALLVNREIESRYWQWVAAIEQIPQDSSPTTTVALTYAQMIENRKTSWAQTTFGVANDPMANIPWPGKLTTAGRRALEFARAAGRQFESARLETRAKTVSAYFDYALALETTRLLEADVTFLETVVEAADARVRAGTAPLQDVVKARSTRELARNKLETFRSRLPGRLAALNALLDRHPLEPLEIPREFPDPRQVTYSDEDFLALLGERNSDLAALAHEAKGKEEAVSLMRQQYIPDLGLGFSADAGGMVRTLMGMVTAPFFRFQAIEASIAQAQAELRMTRAMRRQMENDLKARAILTLYDFRNAERQIGLFQNTILPLADQVVQTSRAAYTAGLAPVLELLDSERMQLEVRLMIADLRSEREKLLAELEALSASHP